MAKARRSSQNNTSASPPVGLGRQSVPPVTPRPSQEATMSSTPNQLAVQQTILDALRQIAGDLQRIEDRFRAVEKMAGHPPQLSDDQSRILSEIEKGGLDLSMSQKRLRVLRGNRVTKDLVEELKRVLKLRRWRVKCGKCEATATLVWSRRKPQEGTSSERGYLRYAHLDKKSHKTVCHGSFCELPPITLIDSEDQES